MTGSGDGSAPAPATALTSDEQILQETVRDFADQVVRPLAREMDATGSMPRSLIDRLFALGLMALDDQPATMNGQPRTTV